MTTPYRTADPPAQTAPTLRERMACALGLHRWGSIDLSWAHGCYRQCARCAAKRVYDSRCPLVGLVVTRDDLPSRSALAQWLDAQSTAV